jgi:hypothetical protein
LPAVEEEYHDSPQPAHEILHDNTKCQDVHNLMKPSLFLRLSGIPERVGVNQEDGNQEFYSC